MAKQRKKFKIGTALICAFIFLILGAGLGIAGKIFLFADSYEIPDTETVTQEVAQGSIETEVVKSQELSIHFIELGNKYTGDCTLIKVGDVEVLIDAGSRASSVQPIYEYVSTYVDGFLDYVIVTHAHQDHYAAFATNENVDSLFDLFNVETVIKFSNTNQKATAKLYSNFNRELEQTKNKKIDPNDESKTTQVYTALECYNNEKTGAQRTYNLGNNVSLEILYHRFYEEKSSTENNYSVCVMINQNDEKYYLFTGDLEEDGESSLVDEYRREYGVKMPEVVLYKAGHHGSKTSSSSKLLTDISPEIVCVCCCAGSSEYTSNKANQFPTQEFIDRIAPHTSQVYVTTMCLDYNKGAFQSFNGNIIVYSNVGGETFVACAKNDILLKDTDWFKQNRTCPQVWKT